MTGRVAFYVQHLLGIGHAKRAAVMADAMAQRGLDVHVIAGGQLPDIVDFSPSRVHELPAVHAPDGDFSRLVDADGAPVDAAFEAMRRDQLIELATTIAPDVMLVEHFPFGRRKFRFELLPLFERLPRHVPVFSSVRDVLVAKPATPPQAPDTALDDGPDALPNPAPARRSKTPAAQLLAKDRGPWIVQTLKDHFSGVLVHGDPSVIAFGETFARAGEIADLLHYTGYVVAQPDVASAQHGRGKRRPVVVAAGGGAVGEDLLRVALEARRGGLLAAHPWIVLTGPNLPDAARRHLAGTVAAIDAETRKAGHGPHGSVHLETARADYAQLLTTAALSISQAGYNTMMDLLAARVPAVVVPFERGGETEQLFRARRFAPSWPRLRVVREADLTPAALATAIGGLALREDECPGNGAAQALAHDRSKPAMDVAIDLNGAARSAEIMEAAVTWSRARCVDDARGATALSPDASGFQHHLRTLSR